MAEHRAHRAKAGAPQEACGQNGEFTRGQPRENGQVAGGHASYSDPDGAQMPGGAQAGKPSQVVTHVPVPDADGHAGGAPRRQRLHHSGKA
jgi:hypothetical protein